MAKYLKYHASRLDIDFPTCPFCKAESVIRHGFCGRHHARFLCKNCKKTFSSTYGTIVYRAKIRAGKIK